LKLGKIDIINAGYGIRTRELLRDRILSPAPLASLANPATVEDGYWQCLTMDKSFSLKKKSKGHFSGPSLLLLFSLQSV
jgi:hypothetical protein